MSRLIDHLLRAKPAPSIHAALKAATVIAADNVAAYLETIEGWDISTMPGLPNIAPPLKTMFIEFRLGKPIGRVGWYLQSFDRTELDYFPSQYVPETDVEGARWMTRGMLYLERYPKQPQMWSEWFVHPDGGLCFIEPGRSKDARYLDHERPYSLQFLMRPTTGSVFMREWENDPYGTWMSGIAMTQMCVLWTLCFMHTKNVSIDTIEPDAKLSRAHQKRGHEPLSVYKVLRITPMGTRSDGTGDGTHAQPSLHIARGHFKTYTEDAPLLGRAVGTWWWSQQLRGRRERGTVQKGYEVTP